MIRCSFPRLPFAFLLCVGSSVAAAACGSSRAVGVIERGSPVAPSSDSAAASTANHTATTPATHGEAYGTVSNLAGSCPSLTFVAEGKRVATNASTEFDDGACANVANGVKVDAYGAIQPDGSILADEVSVYVPRQPPAYTPHAEVDGTVSNLAGSCPSLTFVASGRTIVTNAATRFDDNACASVADGVEVDAHGAAQTDGSILADRLSVYVPHQPPANATHPNAHASGAIAGLAGTCPSITFSLGAQVVVTSASTAFDEKACALLANNARVDVDGTRQQDGSILAVRVDADADADGGDDDDD